MSTDLELLHPYQDIPLRKIRRDRNIRHSLQLDGDFLASIAAQGILIPCTVEPLADDPDGYEWLAVAGHRRMAALEASDQEHIVPCHIVPASDPELRTVTMLVENLQRHDLDPFDEAEAYASIVQAGWTQAELASTVGKSATHVSQRMTLLVLDDDERELVRTNSCSLLESIALARIIDRKLRDKARRRPSWQTIPDFLKDVERTAQLSAEVDERIEQFTAAGITAGRKVPKGSAWIQTENTSWQSGTAIKMSATDAKKHMKAECEFMHVSADYARTLKTTRYCTNPAAHAEPDAPIHVAAPPAAPTMGWNDRRIAETLRREHWFKTVKPGRQFALRYLTANNLDLDRLDEIANSDLEAPQQRDELVEYYNTSLASMTNALKGDKLIDTLMALILKRNGNPDSYEWLAYQGFEFPFTADELAAFADNWEFVTDQEPVELESWLPTPSPAPKEEPDGNNE